MAGQPDRVLVPLAGGGEPFAVRRVFCVGRNYAEHAREMGHDAREAPFFFGKAADAVTLGPVAPYPPATQDLHHEVELVVAIGLPGSGLKPGQVEPHITGYAVGIDLTRRDLQAEAKRLARPWYLAKSWVGAAPMGPLQPVSTVGHPRRGRIWLEVDGSTRQDGDLAEMIWNVDELVATLSGYDRLLPGDLIFTGTPAGVGRLDPGASVRAGIEGVGELELTIAAA